MAGAADAQSDAGPRKLPPIDGRRPPASELFRDVRSRSREILNVQATEKGAPKARNGQKPPADDDDAYYKIDVKPPTREKLFKLENELSYVRGIEREFTARDAKQLFLLPYPADLFDGPDNATLGPQWYQNRKSGSGIDDIKRKGEMRISGRRCEFPAGGKPEAAILDEYIGNENVTVTVDIQLNDPANKFGVVVRCDDPKTWLGDVDQYDENTFYYVALSADSVTVARREAGKEQVLKTARIGSKLKCKLSVLVYGDSIRVSRDDQVVLRVAGIKDTANQYVGLIGLAAKQKPVYADNFFAMRYGGHYQERAYAPSSYVFHGANVHYHPLYFEQVPLERYGHHLGNLFQPFIAHGTFFADFLMAPYSVANSPPWQCHNSEGYEKPGDIVLPFKITHPVCEKPGLTLETAVIALSFSLIP